jgi:hypothetical protein
MTLSKKHQPAAYGEIHKIAPDRNDTAFVSGYAWDTDPLTFQAYTDAKQRFEVPFESADYLVDLWSDPDEHADTFPMAELGYRTLTQQR